MSLVAIGEEGMRYFHPPAGDAGVKHAASDLSRCWLVGPPEGRAGWTGRPTREGEEEKE